MTNGAKIRRMSDAELVEFLAAVESGLLSDKICRDCAAQYGQCLAEQSHGEQCHYTGSTGCLKWLGEEVRTWQ